jgi:hypothetical protein
MAESLSRHGGSDVLPYTVFSHRSRPVLGKLLQGLPCRKLLALLDSRAQSPELLSGPLVHRVRPEFGGEYREETGTY